MDTKENTLNDDKPTSYSNSIFKGKYLTTLFLIISTFIFSTSLIFVNGVEAIHLNSQESQLTMITQVAEANEWDSQIPRQDQQEIMSQVYHLSPNLIVSAEIALNVTTEATGTGDSSILIRGLTEKGRSVRDVEIVDGRWFSEQENELVVRDITTSQNPMLSIGSKILVAASEWQIVGVFSSSVPQPANEVWGSQRRLKEVLHKDEHIQSYYLQYLPLQVRSHLENIFSTKLREDTLVTTVDQFYGGTFSAFRQKLIGGFILFCVISMLMALVLAFKYKPLVGHYDHDVDRSSQRDKLHKRLIRVANVCVCSFVVGIVAVAFMFSGETVTIQLPNNEIAVYLDFTFEVGLYSLIFTCLIGGILRVDKRGRSLHKYG